jgi:uncharacterized protein YlxW (UPF0749 family)
VTDARTLQKGFVLLVPAVLFGFFVAAQWSTFAGPRDVGIRYVEPLNTTVAGLQDEQDSLKAQVSDLRARIDGLQRTAATQSGATRELQARIDDLRAQAGLTATSGEGVLVRLAAGRPIAVGAQERQTCFAPDLTDIVNAAWRGGARAVAINGERLVGSSSVYCVGATIVVNGSLVAAPFEVAAVGDAARLLSVFDDPAQLRDLKRRRDQDAVDLEISRAPLLTLDAYDGPLAARSARPQ